MNNAKQLLIQKTNGELVPFDQEKIKQTCLRAGASPGLAVEVAQKIAVQAYHKMTTQEIMRLTLKILDEIMPAVAARYTLRDAIFRLGPAGFDFEKYVAELLKEYGYDTVIPPIMKGACIDHEVDVLASKDNRTAMIECKLRQSVDIFITLKDVMATWARFLDLVDGAAIGRGPHLDEVWVVTNAKMSHDSVRYGHCKNMVMLSWDHPHERPLPAWIDDKALYPITVLRSLDKYSQTAFAKASLLLVRDLIRIPSGELCERTRIPQDKMERFISEAQAICALSNKK